MTPPSNHPTRRQALQAAAAAAAAATGICTGTTAWAQAQTSAAPAAPPAAAPAVPEGGYRFSPVPQQSIPLVAGYWNPILAWVSARSGVKLQLKISRTSAETTKYVLDQDVEFVFTNHLFSPEREALGWKVFGRRQMPPVSGQIVVPGDSPVTDLAQLEGKEIAFPGPEAFVSYKVPMAHLMSRKIGARPVFAGNLDAAYAQMYSGKTAAAGVNSQMVEAHARRENRKYRVLWSSEPFHDLALMAAAKLPEREVKAVAQAFATMHQDAKGLEILTQVSQTIGLTHEAHFIASDGREYDAYRRFYQSAPKELR